MPSTPRSELSAFSREKQQANQHTSILDEFRGRGWMPLEPKLLDFENTQFLIIGHHEESLEKATVPQPEDEKNDKETPKEEMEKLEHEDDLRVQHLKGNGLVRIYPNECEAD